MGSKNYFKALTGYRAIAAFMIFALHNKQYLSDPDSSFFRFLSGFSLGVPLFFVLSGFLIYTRYQASEISLPFYKGYMINRIARIYPVYFAITTVTLLFNYKAAAFTPYSLKVYFLNITFLRGFFQKYCFTLVAPGWSLTVEEVFYLIAPFIFLFAMGRIRRYFLVFLFFFGLGWLLSFLSINLLHGFFWSTNKFMILNTFFGNSLAFVTGIVVGVLNNRVSATSFKYWTITGIAGLFVSLLLMSRYIDLTQSEEDVHTWKWLFVSNIVAVPFIGILIWGLLRENTLLSRMLSTEVFQVLGKSSYVFYLIHYGILLALLDKFLTENVFVHFAAFIFVSILIWYFFEDPVNEWIRKKAKTW